MGSYSLTRRPYLLVGFFHMIIGLLLFACGVTWLMLTLFYWPQHKNGSVLPGWDVQTFLTDNPWAQMPVEHQAWAWIVYTAQIWTGFWIMTSGCFAMVVRDHGCNEKMFLFMNVLTLILFAPAAIVLSLELFFNVTIAGEGASLRSFSFIYQYYPDAAEMFPALRLNNDDYSWILTFPIVGLSLGFIELVLSLVSCSVCICCRPTRSYSY